MGQEAIATVDKKVEFEITEPVVVEKEVKPTTEEALSNGLSGIEIEAAKKHGLIEDVKKKEEPKAEEKKPAEEVKNDTPVVDEKKGSEQANDEKPDGYDKWTPNEKGLYWDRKKERKRAQRAEAEKELLQLRLNNLTKEVETLKKTSSKPVEKEDEINIDDLLDVAGEKGVVEKEKPLTRSDLENIEKEKAEKERANEEERTAQARALKGRLSEFELEAREQHEDFDEVAEFAREILAQGSKVFDGDEVLTEAAERRAEKALQSMVNAMKWEEGSKTPAELVYDLGKLHPKYRHRAKSGSEREVPPEQVERMIENAGKRSSASLTSGGRRVVTEDDLTPETAARLNPAQYAKLSRATRERLLRM